MRRGGRINPVSAKRQARLEAWPQIRRACHDRAMGWCEVRLGGCARFGDQAHHILRRSQGGRDELSNLLWVCTPCHGHIHANPAESARSGWLITRKDTA